MSNDAFTDRRRRDSRDDERADQDPTAEGGALDHLVDAAKELIGAARSVLDAIEAVIDEQVDRHGEGGSGGTGRSGARPDRDPRVRRIDLD